MGASANRRKRRGLRGKGPAAQAARRADSKRVLGRLLGVIGVLAIGTLILALWGRG